MKKLPLFLFVGIIISTVVLSLFFFIHRFFETQSQTIQTELLNDIANQLNQTVIEKTTNYLMPAEILAKSTSSLIKQNIIQLDNYNQVEVFLLSSIKSYSQIAKLYISDKDGNFSMVFKDKNKTLSSKKIEINKQEETIIKRNKYDQIISRKTKKDKYDAKTRPWFIGANQTEKLYWTDLYIFYTGKRPGITASYPIYDMNNKFNGVVGVDIELAKISEFLSLQKKIYNAQVIILDEKDQIVAQPDNISFTTLEDGAIMPQTIQDIEDEVVKKAISEYKSTLLDRFEIKNELTSYFVSLASFPEYFGKKWNILIILPKAELINFSTNSSTLDLIYIIVLLLFSLLLTLIITFVILNPISSLIEDFDRLEKNNIQDKVPTSIISEISQLINVYLKLKHKSITKPK
jgi:HAMP domain-containing protein